MGRGVTCKRRKNASNPPENVDEFGEPTAQQRIVRINNSDIKWKKY